MPDVYFERRIPADGAAKSFTRDYKTRAVSVETNAHRANIALVFAAGRLCPFMHARARTSASENDVDKDEQEGKE